MTQQKVSANGKEATTAGVPERPALASEVRLLGEMKDTGFEDRQWLVQRGERFIQITELLYRVAEQIDGERTLEEIAAGVTESTEWLVSADNVRWLIQGRLIPLGLIARGEEHDDGAKRHEDRARSLLQIRMRMKLIGPRIINPIAKVLQVLYAPPLLILLLIAAAVAHGWLYFVATRRVIEGLFEIIYNPALILVTIPIMIVATVFHEFGHAAALRYGGGEVRGIGVGVYVADPVIYTDTTDNYRLGRWARVRTDLGGFYFWLLAQLVIIGLYLITEQEFLLFLVVVIDLEIIFQCLPFARFDGYWALASLTGIPDLFSQMRPFLRSVLRTPKILKNVLPTPESSGSKLPDLKAWVKVVFAVWTALTVPVMALFVFLFVRYGPKVLAASWDSFLRQAAIFSAAKDSGDALGMATAGTQMLVLALNILIIVYFMYLLVLTSVRTLWNWNKRGAPARGAAGALIGTRALWNWSKRTPGRRAAGVLVVAFGVIASTYFWAPELVSLSGRTPPDGVQSFKNLSNEHTNAPVTYEQTPPVGGNHAPVWQNCGFYDEPLNDENAVHSMEHGAVWITYRPGLPEEQIEAVRELAQNQNNVLASPYPDLPAPVVASAWGRQIRLGGADDPRLEQFVRAFRLGPQTPEPGAGCTGGKGTPQ